MTNAVTKPGVEKAEMYLQQRDNGVWYFRRPVPSDLDKLFHPTRFTFSLGTRNRQEAVAAYSAALAQSEQDIAYARKTLKEAIRGGYNPGISPWRLSRMRKQEKAKRHRTRTFCQYGEAEIRFLLSRWFAKKQTSMEEIFRKAFVRNDPEERAQIAKVLQEDEDCLLGCTSEADDVLISPEVRAILDEDDCDPPREWLNDPLFCRFYGLITEGLLKLTRMSLSLVQTGELPENFQQKIAAFAHPAGQVAPSLSVGSAYATPVSSIALDELITRFENDPKRKLLRANTIKEYGFIYRLLREQFGGDKPIGTITRDDIRTISDILLYLPARATLPRKGQKKGERLQDISARAKEAGGKQAERKTYNKKIQQVGAIFNWAVTEQLIPSSPARSLALPEPPPNGEEKGYTSEQLQIIFSGELFTQFFADGTPNQFVPDHPLMPCFFWAPLFGLFHGARSGEILQLKTTNVFNQDGIPVFRMVGEIKNHQSFRKAPIHPELIRLGFLEYIDRVRKAGYEMAFPDAKQASDGKYSTWFQRPFGRYLKKIGVKSSRKECFHAFRHTWKTGMLRADASEEIRNAIGGWKRGKESSEGGYGAQHQPRLLKYLEKLSFPDLDLSHLMPEKFGMPAIQVKGTQQDEIV